MSTSKHFCVPSEESVEIFCEKLELLCLDSFIAREQAAFYMKSKTSLQPGEILVMVDLSENYSFFLQDAEQGFHWNNYTPSFCFLLCDSGELCH